MQPAAKQPIRPSLALLRFTFHVPRTTHHASRSPQSNSPRPSTVLTLNIETARHSPMTKLLLAITGLVSASLATATAADYTVHSFKRLFLSEHFWSEGANFGDFNKDGKMDVVSGPYWWEGPEFRQRHEYYPADKTWTKKNDDGSE